MANNPNTPQGFKPSSYQGGAPFTGGTRAYKIASGYAANIFAGDAVKLLTSGYINVAAAAQAIRGIAAGFSWVGADGVPVFKNYWPSGTVTMAAQDATIYVIDDPNVIFEAVFTNSTSVPATADIGALFDLYAGTGSTGSGVSGFGVDYASLNTTLKQFRYLGPVTRPDNDLTGAYQRGYFVAVNHDLRLQTGI
jgi:hypothetical protein